MAFYTLPTRRFLKACKNFSSPFLKQWTPSFVITNTFPPTRTVGEIVSLSDLQVSDHTLGCCQLRDAETPHTQILTSALEGQMSLQHAAQKQPTNRLTSSSPLLMVFANSASVYQFCLARDLSPALCNISTCGKCALCIFQDLFSCHRPGLALPGLFFPPSLLPLPSSQCFNSKAGWLLQLFAYLACHSLSTCCGTELYQAAQCYTSNNFLFQDSNEGCVP